MVTLEQVKRGASLYFYKELSATVRVILKKAGYITEDSMVDIDRIYSELRTIASKTGTVTEHFPLIGDVMFSIDDIDCLRSCILNS